MHEISPLLTKQDSCRSVTRRMVVKPKGRISSPRLARKDRPRSTFHLLAVHSNIRGRGKQCTRQCRPQVPRGYPPSWRFPQAVNSQFRGALGRKRMARDIGIFGTECILVLQRRISVPPSQVSSDVIKHGLFTTFARLKTPVRINIIRTRLNEPAWDASFAFRQYILSWLRWVIVTCQDVRSTSTTQWARLVAKLVAVW